MKNRIRLLVNLSFCLSLIFASCFNPVKKTDAEKRNSVTISGNLQSTNARGVVADSILAMAYIQGEPSTGWEKMPGSVILPNGTFGIELEKTEIDAQGKERALDWVLLLVNTKAPNRFEKITGFLALNELDQSLIKFPLSKAKKDSIKMGNVTQKGNEARADTSIKHDTAYFNMTIAQIREMAHTGKTLKMLKNSYANYNPVTKKNFDVRPTYSLGRMHLADAKNHELTPTEYLDTSKLSYSIHLFFDKNIINFDQLVSKALTVDMYPPVPIYCFVSDSLALVGSGQYISTDTSVNPHVTMDGNGNSQPVNVFILGSSSDEHPSLLFPSFKSMVPNGVWYLKKNRSDIIAMYDLGLGNPFDTLSGKPLIYVPSLAVNVNVADTSIQSVVVKWYSWNPSTGQYQQASDISLIQNDITYVSVDIRDNFNQEDVSYGKAPYGSSTLTPVPLVITMVPTKKWIYTEPVTENKYSVGVTYVTGSQNFYVGVVDMHK